MIVVSNQSSYFICTQLALASSPSEKLLLWPQKGEVHFAAFQVGILLLLFCKIYTPTQSPSQEGEVNLFIIPSLGSKHGATFYTGAKVPFRGFRSVIPVF
jgi:hypothetical protein